MYCNHYWLRLLAATALGMLLATWTSALDQSTATLQGTVIDQQGATIRGAKIIARNQINGSERMSLTDSNGFYELAGLQVGTYRVEVTADGWQDQVIDNVALEVSQTTVQNFQLAISGVQQIVNVREASIVESTTVT